MPLLPPHLIDPELELESEIHTSPSRSKIGLQGPSKYGIGGRRVAKAKGRKK